MNTRDTDWPSLYWFLVVNAGLTADFSTQYVVSAPGVTGLIDVSYLGVGLLSFSVSLYLVVGCVLALER